MGIVQSAEGLSKTEGWGRRSLLLFSCLPALARMSPPLSSCPQTGTHRIAAPPISQAFGLRLDHAISSPWPPTCRQQLVRLLSLYNHVSRFFTGDLHIYTDPLSALFLRRSLTRAQLLSTPCLIGPPRVLCSGQTHCLHRRRVFVPGTLCYRFGVKDAL